MTQLERKVNAHPDLGTLQAGDVVLGERTSGTTGLFTVPTQISDGDKGDITVSGDSWTIDTPSSVTVATDDKVLIKDTSASNVMKYVTAQSIADLTTVTQYTDEMAQDAVGSMTGTSLVYNDGSATLQRAALTGDVTASQDSNTTTIANDAVTYAKMQNVSATDKLLGRSTSGAGDVEEITCTAAGRALLDDADNTAQRTTLGLGTLATQNGTFSGTSSGTNTGDQTSIVGITGTKAEFNTAVSDGNILYVGDDHGSLSGLTDDDHTQYLLADGTRTATSKLTIGGNSTASGYIEFLEDSDNGSNKLTLTPPQSIASDKTVTFQDVTGTVYVSGGTDVVVADGGTGLSSATAYAVLCGGTTSTGAFQSIAALGASGARLTSNGAGALPTMKGGLNAFHAYQSGTPQSITQGTFTKVQFNTELVDTGGMYDNATNYRYTPTIAGKYFVSSQVSYDAAFAAGKLVIAMIYKNGAAYAETFTYSAVAGAYVGLFLGAVVDMNGSTDYLEIYTFQADTTARNILIVGTSATYFSGFLVEPA